MGGKGQRRREKNFRAAHGGNSRLPPPPKAKELDALPSKLRRLMELKNPSSTNTQGPVQSRKDSRHEKRRESGIGEKKTNPRDAHALARSKLKVEDDIKKMVSSDHIEEEDISTSTSSDVVRKGKRKRKSVDDLRFQNLNKAEAGSRRKERKKEYFESRKKKHKKPKSDDIRDFLGQEEIKFGDVVEAPPKLSFPKAPKASIDASQERVRLQAVEAYRSRRGWGSRFGLQLPLLGEDPSA